MATRHLRDAVAIAGVGETEYSRRSGRSPVALAVEASMSAAEDAGIDVRDIDGFLPYASGVTTEDMMANLSLRELTFAPTIRMGGASAVAGLLYAALALRAGLATYILLLRARNGSSGPRVGDRKSTGAGEELKDDFELPFGLNTPAQRYALMCRRHMYEFGTTREQLGAVALAHRAHANRNPAAIMHDRTLSMDEYLAARPIAEPYHLYDCCLESDGGAAVILTTPERARDTRHSLVLVGGVAEGHPPSADSLVGRHDLLEIGLTRAAGRAWSMAGLGPSDMDAAMIYDCFTFQTIQQLEEAGFCPRGEGGAFVADGSIGPGGSLPVNTHGGLLSQAHVLGLNHLVEAVRQLRGVCGDRQIPLCDAIAVSGWGDLGDGALAVLHR